MRRKYWNEGVTLIEIAVVMSIIGIGSALAIPSIVGMLPRFQLNSQTSALHNDLQRARLKSVNLNTPYRILFTLDTYPDADSYEGQLYDAATSNWVSDPEMTSLQIHRNVDIAYVYGSSSGTVQIRFNPDGTAGTDYDYIIASIRLKNKDELKKEIRIKEETGFIKIYNDW